MVRTFSVQPSNPSFSLLNEKGKANRNKTDMKIIVRFHKKGTIDEDTLVRKRNQTVYREQTFLNTLD